MVSVAALTWTVHGVVEVAVGERADLRRHGGAEQRRLAAARAQREDLLDVLEEAEVEHLVGLVEHDVAAGVQQQRVARDEVEHAADRPDHDLALLLELRLLGADRRAAEDGDGVDALAGAVGAQRLGDLDAELARRGEDERLDLAVVGVDELDHRQPEGGGLAGSGLRLADHVAAVEQFGDRLLLDGAWILVADVVKRGENGLGKSERVKGCHSDPDPRRVGRMRARGREACSHGRGDDHPLPRRAAARARPVPHASTRTARRSRSTAGPSRCAAAGSPACGRSATARTRSCASARPSGAEDRAPSSLDARGSAGG